MIYVSAATGTMLVLIPMIIAYVYRPGTLARVAHQLVRAGVYLFGYPSHDWPPGSGALQAYDANYAARRAGQPADDPVSDALDWYNQPCTGADVITPDDARNMDGLPARDRPAPVGPPDATAYASPIAYALAFQTWQEARDRQTLAADAATAATSAALTAGWSASAWEVDQS